MGSSCSHSDSKINSVHVQEVEVRERGRKHKTFQTPEIALPERRPATLTNYGLISDRIVTNRTDFQTEYDTTLRALKQETGKFLYQDTSFPPQLSSLTKDIKYFEKAGKLIWKRPANFLDLTHTSQQVFEDGIMPEDVLQGDLGDCYFLSSLSVLAGEDQKLIRRLFVTQEVNQWGCYCIWLCHDGEWKEVILDDNFPCEEHGGPAFSQANGTELWVLLLEKAYAKIFGAYDKIESGLSGHALRDLTGAPYKYLCREPDQHEAEDYPEQVWKFITLHLKTGEHVLTASTEKNQRQVAADHQEDYLGIVSGHCYAVLDAREVTDNENHPARIIKIRNPWGKGQEWTGDWWDKSEKWTPYWRKELKVTDTDDGEWWMDLQKFCEFYPQLCVSMLMPDYNYTSLRLTGGAKEQITTKVIAMKVYQKMHGFIQISQRDKRNWAKNSKVKYEYSLFRIIVAKVDASNRKVCEFIADQMECERDIVTECDLEEGFYIIYAEVEWAQDLVRDFVLSMYGSDCVYFQEVKLSQQQTDDLLEDLIDCHHLKETDDRVQKYKDNVQRITGSFCGYVYFYYQNMSTSEYLKETVTLTERKYLQICAPFTKSDEFKVEVAPGESQMVKYRVDAVGRGEYHYKITVSYILLENLAENEALLRERALSNPSKIKQREMHGHFMEVYVHSYFHYGGVAFLYINRTRNKKYVEDLELDLTNLTFADYKAGQPTHIEVLPQDSYLLNIRAINPSEEIFYKMKMSYFLK